MYSRSQPNSGRYNMCIIYFYSGELSQQKRDSVKLKFLLCIKETNVAKREKMRYEVHVTKKTLQQLHKMLFDKMVSH